MFGNNHRFIKVPLSLLSSNTWHMSSVTLMLYKYSLVSAVGSNGYNLTYVDKYLHKSSTY